jgi:hypothetical protein
MSLSAAARALGSCFIDDRCPVPEPEPGDAWSGGKHLFTGSPAARKGRGRRRRRAIAHAGNAGLLAGTLAPQPYRRGVPAAGVPEFEVAAKARVMCLEKQAFPAVPAVNWSRPGQFFSSIINSTSRSFGDHAWDWGFLNTRLAWKCER